VTPEDLWLIGGLDALVVVLGLAFYNKFLAVCFDEEFTRIRGIRVEVYHTLLLCLTALTVVLLVTVVGIVMVIALLTLPAATAAHFSRKLWHMMILSSVFTVFLTTAGMAISYGPDLPAGATIIILAGIFYISVVVFTRMRRRAGA
jgi:zinc transport system permease protein